MRIIGFSAGTISRDSNVDRMVRVIMAKSGYESEFVKLTDLNYSACKGCVWLCAGPEVCRLEDALLPYYQKVKEANAVVLGSQIHFSTISAPMSAFVSRLWGFRHVNFTLKNKPFVLVLCGFEPEYLHNDTAGDDFRRVLRPFEVDVIDVVRYCSKTPPCFRCGRHQGCLIGGAYKMWGNEALTLDITPKLFCKWEDHPETVAKIEVAARKLRNAMFIPTRT